jgi:hypothetical protein
MGGLIILGIARLVASFEKVRTCRKTLQDRGLRTNGYLEMLNDSLIEGDIFKYF